MNAIAIGPLVFAPDRFAAILALFAFVLVSEILARKVDRRFSSWGFGTVLAFIIGARAGHVVLHLDSFTVEPLRIFALWQGGFHIGTGIACAVLFTLFSFRRTVKMALWTAVPGAIASYIAFFILTLTAGTPDTPLPNGSSYMIMADEPFRAEELHGKPLVINLWATWCPPCRREMPMMADIASQNDDATFVFVNQGEARETIEQYLAKEGLEIGNIVRDSLGEFARHYSAPGLPVTLFIGADGKLQALHMGEISREALTAGIQAIE